MLYTRTFVLACICAAVLQLSCFRTSSPSSERGQPSQPADPKSMSSPPSNTDAPIVGPVRYLALGDSTGAGQGAKSGGYVARLFRKIQTHRPESKLTNRCFSGATTSDLLNEQMDGIAELNPNLVTIGIGINDIGHGISISTFEKNYDLILSRLRANTQAAIVITNIPEISTAPRIPQIMRTEYQQTIVKYNQKLEEVAARHGATVFDVYAVTHEELPKHPEYFSADGFHPSDQGYELWAETMWPTIARIVGIEGSL